MLSALCLRLSAIRSFSTTAVRVRYRRSVNSGVSRRLTVIQEDEADVIDKSDIKYEDIESLEEDFMQAGEMSDEIASQMQSIRKAQEYRITERKHFKPPKEPNMLTWSEKEQIRFLHQSEPEKWTPVSLAESFPTSPTIVKKLLKNTWKPLSKESLIAHDKRVSNNWIAFHQGQLEVHDPRLKAHLAKFVDRKNGVQTATEKEAQEITNVVLLKPKKTEFLSLVTSFKPVRDETNADTESNRLEENFQPIRQINGSDKLTIRGNYTLSQLRAKLENKAEEMTKVPDEIKAIIGTKDRDNSENNSLPYVAQSEKFKPNAVVYQKRNKAHLVVQDLDNPPDKIQIPAEKRKPGQLYRVNDSFYSDRGDFLYRVPGLNFG